MSSTVPLDWKLSGGGGSSHHSSSIGNIAPSIEREMGKHFSNFEPGRVDDDDDANVLE